MYKKISYLLKQKDKRNLFLLILFSIFIAIIETIGVTALMPFISVAINFDLVISNKYYNYIYNIFNFNTPLEFVLFLGIGLVIFYFIRAFFNLFYLYLLAKFSKGLIHSISIQLFKNFLGFSYKDYVNKNSSELSKILINETHNLAVLINAVLLLISEVFVIIFIYTVMIYMNYQITLVITIFLLLNGFFLIKKISKVIKKQGIKREEYQKKFYEILNSSFGNYKIIKLQSNDNIVVDKFTEASEGFKKSAVIFESLYYFPKVFLETLGFSIVTLIIVYLIYIQNNDISSVMSILSMFILGLYRLMPSANRLLTSYNQIMYYHKALDLIYDKLSHKIETLSENSITFQNEIMLKNISFSYNDKSIIDNLDLKIKKNEKIAFIGPSGSGKSTLVDIIIGLYSPTSGQLLVDGCLLSLKNIKKWRKKIGYIPQQVYLFDGTVAENISFGCSYNEQKVIEVLKKAKILDFLEIHQEGIHTFVGEGGIKLSGGQKQRIAIARALYQEPEILILDEATSALDEAIEKEIMDEIYEISENKTLIIIAHRLSTINRCEKVYRINNKKIEIVNSR